MTNHEVYSYDIEIKTQSGLEEIKEKSKQELLAIRKIAFQKCFEDWKKRWHKGIITEGGYLKN